MCFRNCWYAAIFESQANNPKIKTSETVSRLELNSSVKQSFKGESLLENRKINWEGLILDQKIEISELQPRINLLFNRLCKVKCRLTRKAEMLKRGNTENRKYGNTEIRIIRKSANLKSIRNRRQSQKLETAVFV